MRVGALGARATRQAGGARRTGAVSGSNRLAALRRLSRLPDGSHHRAELAAVAFALAAAGGWLPADLGAHLAGVTLVAAALRYGVGATALLGAVAVATFAALRPDASMPHYLELITFTAAALLAARMADELRRERRARSHVESTLDATRQRFDQMLERERAIVASVRRAGKLESLDVLAGRVAHDFRNLLTSIMGHADLAAIKTPPDQPVDENLLHIGNAAQTASTLAEQLLEYARPRPLRLAPLDVSEAVHQMAMLLSVSIARDACLRCDLASNLPPIEADAPLLKQVLLNLILNASDALCGQPGQIRLVSGLREIPADQGGYWAPAPPAPGTYVYLAVQDTGSGMDEETLARLFDAYFTTKAHGTGLGMVSVLEIMGQHGGVVGVESAVGRGSTFTLLFPPAGR